MKAKSVPFWKPVIFSKFIGSYLLMESSWNLQFTTKISGCYLQCEIFHDPCLCSFQWWSGLELIIPFRSLFLKVNFGCTPVTLGSKGRIVWTPNVHIQARPPSGIKRTTEQPVFALPLAKWHRRQYSLSLFPPLKLPVDLVRWLVPLAGTWVAGHGTHLAAVGLRSGHSCCCSFGVWVAPLTSWHLDFLPS